MRLFFVLFVLISLNLSAQNSDLLVGKWKYSEMHQEESLTKDAREMFDKFFKETMLHFHNDGSYDAFVMRSDDGGKWTISDDGLIVTLTSDKKSIGQDISIVALDEKKFIMSFSDKGALVMERTSGK